MQKFFKIKLGKVVLLNHCIGDLIMSTEDKDVGYGSLKIFHPELREHRRKAFLKLCETWTVSQFVEVANTPKKQEHIERAFQTWKSGATCIPLRFCLEAEKHFGLELGKLAIAACHNERSIWVNFKEEIGEIGDLHVLKAGNKSLPLKMQGLLSSNQDTRLIVTKIVELNSTLSKVCQGDKNLFQRVRKAIHDNLPIRFADLQQLCTNLKLSPEEISRPEEGNRRVEPLGHPQQINSASLEVVFSIPSLGIHCSQMVVFSATNRIFQGGKFTIRPVFFGSQEPMLELSGGISISKGDEAKLQKL